MGLALFENCEVSFKPQFNLKETVALMHSSRPTKE